MTTYLEQTIGLLRDRIKRRSGSVPQLVWIGNSHADRYLDGTFAGYTVFRAGVSGGTIFDMAALPLAEIFAMAPAARVLISLGSNEVNQKIPLDATFINAVKTVVTVAMGSGRRAWLCTDPPPAWYGDGALLGDFGPVNALINLIATNSFCWSGTSAPFPAGFPLQFINFASLTSPGQPAGYCDPLDTIDTIHRSKQGYDRMQALALPLLA